MVVGRLPRRIASTTSAGRPTLIAYRLWAFHTYSDVQSRATMRLPSSLYFGVTLEYPSRPEKRAKAIARWVGGASVSRALPALGGVEVWACAVAGGACAWTPTVAR